MNDTDLNNMMKQINNMLQNDELPNDLKNIINNFKNSSNNTDSSNEKDNSSNPEIDLNTILKMKQIVDSLNSNKDDPRANLLMSLKPYLKESRQKKVDQYVKLFGLSKAFETFNILGGENKNDV